MIKNNAVLAVSVTVSIIVALILTALIMVRDNDDNDSKKTTTSEPTSETSLREPQTSRNTPSRDVEDTSEELPDHVVDDLFLSFLREQTDDWDLVPDRDVLKLGLLVCDGWDVGVHFSEALEEFIKAGYTVDTAATFMGASTAAFCQEHETVFDANA